MPAADVFQNVSYASCGVVASAGILLQRQYGPLIDSHDAVFRFNSAYTKGAEVRPAAPRPPPPLPPASPEIPDAPEVPDSCRIGSNFGRSRILTDGRGSNRTKPRTRAGSIRISVAPGF